MLLKRHRVARDVFGEKIRRRDKRTKPLNGANESMKKSLPKNNKHFELRKIVKEEEVMFPVPLCAYTLRRERKKGPG